MLRQQGLSIIPSSNGYRLPLRASIYNSAQFPRCPRHPSWPPTVLPLRLRYQYAHRPVAALPQPIQLPHSSPERPSAASTEITHVRARCSATNRTSSSHFSPHPSPKPPWQHRQPGPYRRRKPPSQPTLHRLHPQTHHPKPSRRRRGPHQHQQ